jgi:hypothetical protein
MEDSERQKRREARDKVNNAPYVPLLDGNDALRASHALEYIAAQLWEIRTLTTKLIEKEKGS